MTLPAPIVVDASRLRDFDVGSRLEWLETDGRGGYAAGTAIGANTRRYHGLLVTARRPPTDRIVLLSRLEETLVLPDGERHELATNLYPGTLHPRGHLYLEEFRLDPWPVWRYRVGEVTLTKSLYLARDVGATVVEYALDGEEARLELRPLVAGRDSHALVTANDAVAREARTEPAPADSASAAPSAGFVVHRPYPDVPLLVLSHDPALWQPGGDWYYCTLYPRERERGLEDAEDLFCPGTLIAELRAGQPWRVACATERVAVAEADAWAEAERERRARWVGEGRGKGRGKGIGEEVEGEGEGGGEVLRELGARLRLAAEAFLVRRGDGLSILAGYPWFADWGRDAMISLPGLCIVTGRLDEAMLVLRTFAAHERDGLIPNRFPDDGGEVPDDHYNAVDASLWFIEAVGALADAASVDAVHDLWPTVRAIIEGYRRGTRFGIGVDADGLVRHGAEGVQLTWMDAKVDGWVVTPRDGKAVEVNALWYNALRRAAELARGLGGDAPGRGAGAPSEATDLDAEADRVRAAFAVFHAPVTGALYDRIEPDGKPDSSIRPNQLFAVSLCHSPLEAARARRVVEVVERELLVPLGVRTLAPGDGEYVGSYGGSQHARDSAYHRGTAWPWLIGPFATAYLRVHGRTDTALSRVRALLEPFAAHLHEDGLGQIVEVVAGDPPHAPGGCPAQAWSCAELLRALALLETDTEPFSLDLDPANDES